MRPEPQQHVVLCEGFDDRSLWLDAAPEGLHLPRSYSHSFYAKWFSDHGAGNFYECLWQDEAVVGELRKHLEAQGSWQRVEGLIRD